MVITGVNSLQDNAFDELGDEREIHYVPNPTQSDSRLLVCTRTNVLIYDFEDQLPNIFSEDLDSFISNLQRVETSKIIANPPDWWNIGVGAQANAREAINFLYSATRPYFQNNCSYNLILLTRFKKALCCGENEFLLLFEVFNNGRAFSTSKTIVAHEVYHAFIKKNIKPVNSAPHETIALVESYCDIFAVLFNNRQRNQNNWDWRIGYEIEKFNTRDLNPNAESSNTIDMSAFVAAKGQATNNSLIHSQALYRVLRTKDDEGNWILDAHQGTSLITIALSKIGLVTRSKLTFERSRFLLTSAVSTLYPDDERRKQILSNAIEDSFNAANVK